MYSDVSRKYALPFQALQEAPKGGFYHKNINTKSLALSESNTLNPITPLQYKIAATLESLISRRLRKLHINSLHQRFKHVYNLVPAKGSYIISTWI